ncbi:hypothetical protein LKK83_05735 [Phormidium sp. CCY1219]|nr:hypothetical protein [Phormidium sp. CCY1219]
MFNSLELEKGDRVGINCCKNREERVNYLYLSVLGGGQMKETAGKFCGC